MIEILVVLIMLMLFWGTYPFSSLAGFHALDEIQQLMWAQRRADQAVLEAHQESVDAVQMPQYVFQETDLPQSYILSASTRSASILFSVQPAVPIQMPYVRSVAETIDGKQYNTRAWSRSFAPSTALAEKHLLYGGRRD